MKLVYRVIAIFFLMIVSHTALVACEEKIYEGIYARGFEYSGFEAVESEEVWWVSGDIQQLRKLLHSKLKRRKSAGSIYGQAKVKLKGKLSKKGQYGHMGRYNRELIVTEVISAKKIE